jgi:hypothetical protein
MTVILFNPNCYGVCGEVHVLSVRKLLTSIGTHCVLFSWSWKYFLTQIQWYSILYVFLNKSFATSHFGSAEKRETMWRRAPPPPSSGGMGCCLPRWGARREWVDFWVLYIFYLFSTGGAWRGKGAGGGGKEWAGVFLGAVHFLPKIYIRPQLLVEGNLTSPFWVTHQKQWNP